MRSRALGVAWLQPFLYPFEAPDKGQKPRHWYKYIEEGVRFGVKSQLSHGYDRWAHNRCLPRHPILPGA